MAQPHLQDRQKARAGDLSLVQQFLTRGLQVRRQRRGTPLPAVQHRAQRLVGRLCAVSRLMVGGVMVTAVLLQAGTVKGVRAALSSVVVIRYIRDASL